jgi:hypothetical protein
MSRERFELFVHTWFPSIPLDDLEPANSPGYWRQKTPCGGLAGGCQNELHRTLFNEGPVQHAIGYQDEIRDGHGRFISPYRTWREAKEAAR